jgi:hypothetical protein
MPKNKRVSLKKPQKTTVRRTVAPVSVGFQPPEPSFRSVTPSKGCAAYAGVDFIGQLSSTTSAQATSYLTMFCGDATAFPRLSGISKTFRRYYFKKLKYHLMGRSASTQKGNIGFSSMVDDHYAADASVNSETEVKNMQGCLVLKGWEGGTHVVDTGAQGFKWYTCDSGESADYIFNPGFTYFAMPLTAAAGDLSWDVYVEYEIEFDIAIASTINAFKRERTQKALIIDSKTNASAIVEDIEDMSVLLKQLKELEKKVSKLSTSGTTSAV